MTSRSFAALALIFGLIGTPSRAQVQSFPVFAEQLWPDAQAKGVTRATFDRRDEGVMTHRPPRHRRHQEAAGIRQAGRRVCEGCRIAAAHHARTTKSGGMVQDFRRCRKDIRRRALGADRVVGNGNRPTAPPRITGTFSGRLSTLAYVRYRHPYFRNELIVAMGIMQNGHYARDQMVSSWAGAMGQTQFMPTNVIDFAIDFSGDGKSDIWNNVPDVLGSTGNYLHKGHWVHGMPWGFEVIVPWKGFDYRKSHAPASRNGAQARRAPRRWQSISCNRSGNSVFSERRRRTRFCGDAELRRAEGI